jgi:hypothetical protein
MSPDGVNSLAPFSFYTVVSLSETSAAPHDVAPSNDERTPAV